jgi:putative DNA primase/helicase
VSAPDLTTAADGAGVVIDESANAASFTGEPLPVPAGDLTPPYPDRPRLQIPPDGARLDETVQHAESILAPYIYTNGPRLVWIGEARKVKPEYKIQRADDQRLLIAVNPVWVCRKLSAVADVMKFDARSSALKETGVPDRIAHALVGQGNWPNLRPLDAIVRAPFVRENGTVCDSPGYDEESRCFYDPNAEFPELPATVTREDALDALATLRAPFDQFPWKSPAAESAFLAHILTEAARLAIDYSPVFWYSAPKSGTGKGLLSKMPATIVHGEPPAMRPWVESEEIRKNLFASLMSGDRSIAFDNLPTSHKFRSPTLCAFVTAETWKDRVLGATEVTGVPNRAVVSATGNNVTPAGDLSRRSLIVRLDADTPNLKDRVFKIEDLGAHVRSYRVELLTATLIIIRGYKQQSGHVGPVTLPGFERWSRAVRDPLIWLGMADPCESQKDETDSDDEEIKLGSAFVILAAIFGDRPFTPGDLRSRVQSILDADGKLASALSEAGCSNPQDAQKLGYWLREHRDQHGAGYKLEWASGSGNNAKKYRLRPPAATASVQPVSNSDLVGGEA